MSNDKDATQPSAEPVAWIEVRDDGEEPDLTADPLWAKHYPGKWLPLFLHPSPADEAVRRDAERLDFLDSLNAALNLHYGTDYGWRLILSPNIVRLMSGRHQNGYVGDIDLNDSEGSKHRGKSCRDAIDAAMQRTSGGD